MCGVWGGRVRGALNDPRGPHWLYAVSERDSALSKLLQAMISNDVQRGAIMG